MPDGFRKLKAGIVILLAAVAGAAVAGIATVASAQGPGDYTTSTVTSTVTSTTTLPAVDTRLELRLQAKKQKLKGNVKVKASCGEPCFVGAEGNLVVNSKKKKGKVANKKKKYKLKDAFTGIQANSSATLKLKVPKKGLKSGKKALRSKKGKARAKVSLAGFDAARNVDRANATVKFKKPKKKK